MRQEELVAETNSIAEQSYNQLEGEWSDWLGVARRYEGKVPYQDRLDMRHDILLELYHARQRDGEPIPLLRAYRIASLMVALYWRKLKRIPTMLSLEDEHEDTEGNIIQLKETIADDKAIDLEAWLDDKTFLLGCPLRLIELARKRRYGIPLNGRDQRYFTRQRQREWARYQKTLL